jgi:hypothetical protein
MSVSVKMWGTRVIRRTAISINLGIPGDSEGPPFCWARLDPYSGIDRSPEGEQAVDIAMMQEENRIES